MKLISSICHFTDEQQVIVGLKVPPASSLVSQLPVVPSNIASSLYGVLMGSNTTVSNDDTNESIVNSNNRNISHVPPPLEVSKSVSTGFAFICDIMHYDHVCVSMSMMLRVGK